MLIQKLYSVIRSPSENTIYTQVVEVEQPSNHTSSGSSIGENSDNSLGQDSLAHLNISDRSNSSSTESASEFNSITERVSKTVSDDGHKRGQGYKMPLLPDMKKQEDARESGGTSGLDPDQARRLAENSKAKLLQPEGRDDDDTYDYRNDDKFFYRASHVDKTIQEHIKRGDVDVDISKLLFKRKLSHDSKLEIINKEGRSYFIPHGEQESPVINNYRK